MYTYTWKKYLPVIRLLLKKSANAGQAVVLNRTDFEKTTKLRKPSCSFSFEVVKGKLASANASAPGKDLLSILQEDQIARQLLQQNSYLISFNADFQLNIKSLETPVTATEA